jgi:uncharacterized protein YprB with RNaseH-like and TPR domain
MLKNTFLHISGIGIKTEQRFWESGIHNWNDFAPDYPLRLSPKRLETLLAYNIQDTVTLETLMVIAYSLKLKNTPFAESHQLPLPVLPENPFKVNRETVEMIKRTSMERKGLHF